jgi:hypothetical protein
LLHQIRRFKTVAYYTIHDLTAAISPKKMLLQRLFTKLVPLIIAGALQGSSATPVPEPFEGGLMVRGVGSSSSLQPAAAPPVLFFYDPPHMPEINHQIIPAGNDECNMLLSVKRKGDQVRITLESS